MLPKSFLLGFDKFKIYQVQTTRSLLDTFFMVFSLKLICSSESALLLNFKQIESDQFNSLKVFNFSYFQNFCCQLKKSIIATIGFPFFSSSSTCLEPYISICLSRRREVENQRKKFMYMSILFFFWLGDFAGRNVSLVLP